MRYSVIEKIVFAVSLILSLSSCNNDAAGTTDTQISAISPTETVFSVTGTAPPPELPDTLSSSELSASTSVGTEYTAPPSDTSSGSVPEYEETEDTAGDIVTASSGTQGTQQVIQESSLTAASTAAKTTAAAKTEAAAKKKDPVIPEVKVPSASGEKVINGKHSVIDYSNASEGYIAASCSGSGADVKLRITCGKVQYDHDMIADGKTEYFPLMGSGSYTVKMYEQFSGRKYAEVLSGTFDAKVKDDTITYLYPNKYVNFSKSSKCVKKAAELCDGKDGDVERIAAIFEYVAGNTVYDKKFAAEVKDGYIPDPDSTLESKKGICFDYSSLFAAMCRSQGIPARIVVGYAEPNIYHAWNEIYTPETGWLTPEVFLKKKGYNTADATFYAGYSDKKKAADYITNEKNYSAMYRY